MSLRLKLFGAPQVLTDDARPAHVGPKPLALLTYLALEPGRHRRDALTALLWSDAPDNLARTSLRQALYQLRGVIGPALAADRDTVALAAPPETDVGAFLAAIEKDPEGAARYDPAALLEGFTVPNAAGFEEWVEGLRQRLQRMRNDALRIATERSAKRSHWRDAARWAAAWLEADPLAESAVRALVEARFMGGDAQAAIHAYRSYRDRLLRETGGTPSEALDRYVARLEETPPPAKAVAPSAAAVGREHAALDARLYGREDPWETLTSLWSDVTSGRSRIALIEGEPGAGKTRLTQDFLRWAAAQGGTVLRGRGYGPDAGVPYAAAAEALGGAIAAPGLSGAAPEWLAEAARLVPHARARFPHLPTATHEGDTDRRWRLFEGVAQVVAALAAERPTVLAIDDIQASDADSCALLHFLTRRLEGSPLFIIVTLTLGDLERASAAARLCRAVRADARTTIIPLPPLTEDTVHALIHDLGRLATRDEGRRLAARIHQVTDGNPFHVVELLKAMFDQGLLIVDESSGEWLTTPALDAASYEDVELPQTVRAAIEDRCARLAYEQRDLLATVAVARRGARVDLLSLIHGISRLRAAALADALVERRLLAEEDGVYRCAHPVVEEVVRGILTPARHAELDRAIALALDQLPPRDDGVAGDIARHAARGGEAALAFRSALAASDAALKRFAVDEALAWIDLATEVAPTPEASREADVRTAHILEMSGGSVPAQRGRTGTPSRGFRRRDLDLRMLESGDDGEGAGATP